MPLTGRAPQLTAVRTLARTAPSPIVVVDLVGRVLLWNPAATQLFGWTESELLGTPLPCVDRERAECLHAPTESDPPGGVEARLLRRDGTSLQALVERTTLRDAMGDAFAIALRISEPRDGGESGRMLRELHRRAISSRLTRGLAHDFNNALTIIQCNIALAAEELAAVGVATAHLDEAFEATRSAGSLARRLVRLSRSRPGRPRPVDLALVVDGVVHVLRRSVPKTVEIVIAHEPGPHMTAVDPGDLEHVLADLLLRACDAMPDGGVIRIQCAGVAVTSVEQHGDLVLPIGDYASVSIIDTRHAGPQAPPAPAPGAISDSEPTGEFAIAETVECARLAGGHLVVRTVPGCATLFTLYLPRVAPRAG